MLRQITYTWLVAHNVCQILVIITQKSHWSYWAWLEPHPCYSDCSDDNKLFLSQAGDGAWGRSKSRAWPHPHHLLKKLLWVHNGAEETTGGAIWGQTQSPLNAASRAGQQVAQNRALVIARKGGCTSHRREERRQGAASQNTHCYRGNLLTLL